MVGLPDIASCPWAVLEHTALAGLFIPNVFFDSECSSLHDYSLLDCVL